MRTRTRKPIKARRTRMILLPPSLDRALVALAAAEGRTPHAQIIHILAQAVDYHYYQETELIHHG